MQFDWEMLPNWMYVSLEMMSIILLNIFFMYASYFWLELIIQMKTKNETKSEIKAKKQKLRLLKIFFYTIIGIFIVPIIGLPIYFYKHSHHTITGF